MAIILDGLTGITTPGLTNTGTETIVNLTTTGNTTLGDATTDTLTVGVTGIVKDASGNVGIGTASPGYALQVGINSTSVAIGGSATSNGTARLKFLSSNTVKNWQISTNDSIAGALEFTPSTAAGGSTFTTPSMLLDTNGNLLVGGTTSTARFVATSTSTSQIVARVYANSSAYATETMQIITDTASGTGYNLLAVYSGGGTTYAFRVRGDGQLYTQGLGTGTLYTNAGVLTNTNPSDERLKKDIADLSWGLQDILKLRPVSYTWKNNPTNQGKQYGFIAQEVQDVMPELVREFECEEDKETVMRLGLEKDGIYVAMVKAIQEQQALIQSLTTRITALETK